jgi:hypothetical protein
MEQVLRSNFTLIDAHFIDKIKNKISRTQVPVGGTCKHNLYCQENFLDRRFKPVSFDFKYDMSTQYE